MNDDELNKLNQDILKSGLSKESYLRKLILKNKISEKPDINFYKLENEFNAIGRNLNQLTRQANMQNYDSKNIEICISQLQNLACDLEKKVK